VRLTGSPSDVFTALLAGTGLTVKLIAPGSYVLVVTTPPRDLETLIVTVPEVLVVGRRSQNADTERQANDIQPYRVMSSHDVEQAHSTGAEELLRNGIPSNALGALAAQQPSASGASLRSTIDLRGLGAQQTLILVDGRRLPAAPADNNFFQSDLAGIPLAAIERVETLGGTASGLYGPSATGGVVNIVLKQHYPGLWIQSQGGVDQRGDGAQSRLDGGFSWSSADDRTQLSVLAGYSEGGGLTFGDRSFVQRAYAQNQAFYSPPSGGAVNVRSANPLPLTLAAQYGGRSLSSTQTNLPINAGGAGGDLSALLQNGAGAFDTALGNDGNGARQTLLTPYRTRSVIANVHHDFGSRLEMFGNVLSLRDEGSATVSTVAPVAFRLSPGELGNPFTNPVDVTTPTPGAVATDRTTSDTLRATVGLVAHLDHSWNLEADASYGRASLRQTVYLPVSLAKADVFTPGAGLADAIAALKIPPPFGVILDNTMQDYSVRLAGPLARSTAGPITLSAFGEWRDENTPGLRQTGFEIPPQAAHRQQVASAGGELRVPLVAQSSPIVLLRGLELQFAGRGDRYAISSPNPEDGYNIDPPLQVRARHATFTFTVGTKVSPLKGVTLRASYASGYAPPSSADIQPAVFFGSAGQFEDPRRPGSDAGAGAKIALYGTPTLEPELAKTFSIGLILQPTHISGLRASVDYTRIEKSHEITQFEAGDLDYFLNHETDIPGHVFRAPLTAADTLLGYTGGVVTELDATYRNSGHTVIEAVDFDVDYRHSLGSGTIHLMAAATWEPNFTRQTDPSQQALQYSGLFDGPLPWKGSVGAEWSQRGLSLSLRGQYAGSYSTANSEYLLIPDDGQKLDFAVVPAQFYLDAGISHSTAAPGGGKITYELAVQNLLDHTPPFVSRDQSGSEGGYSFYGDPRGRRVIAEIRFAF
jgi:iron complex outermembrane receptor protein